MAQNKSSEQKKARVVNLDDIEKDNKKSDNTEEIPEEFGEVEIEKEEETPVEKSLKKDSDRKGDSEIEIRNTDMATEESKKVLDKALKSEEEKPKKKISKKKDVEVEFDNDGDDEVVMIGSDDKPDISSEEIESIVENNEINGIDTLSFEGDESDSIEDDNVSVSDDTEDEGEIHRGVEIEVSGSVKDIHKYGRNKELQIIDKITVDKDIIQKNSKPGDANDPTFAEYFRRIQKSSIVAPRYTKIVAPASGSSALISAYGSADIFDVYRSTNAENYVESRYRLFQTIHEHIIEHSDGDPLMEKMISFEDWLAKTFFVDMKNYFFGTYISTFPGEMKVRIKCGKCGAQTEIVRNPREINYVADEAIDKQQLNALMRENDPKKLKELPIHKKAKKLRFGRILQSSKYYVEYSLPSVKDYLDTLAALEDFGVDVRKMFGPDADNIDQLYKIFLFISKLSIPIPKKHEVDGEDGGVKTVYKVSYREISERNIIIPLLLKLDMGEFKELILGDELVKLIDFNPVEHVLKDIVCSNSECNSKFDMYIDMEDFYFLQVKKDVIGLV